MESTGQRSQSNQANMATASPAVTNAFERFFAGRATNVGSGEQAVSLAAGAFLALGGLARRDVAGWLIAGVGGALLYRGATGHCPLYQALEVNTASEAAQQEAKKQGLHLVQSYSINKPREELYRFWRNLENLPKIMSHLESVRVLDDRRSQWTASAPQIAGRTVEWEAEITADEPGRRISWQSSANSAVSHQGTVEFSDAPGDRGTLIRVSLDYRPIGGQLGRLAAWFSGESPEQQIREDLRNFKRAMESGEVPTILGQPHGSCLGLGLLRSG
jgi:uncharacterized membrane protein